MGSPYVPLDSYDPIKPLDLPGLAAMVEEICEMFRKKSCDDSLKGEKK
jgi:hypothetical protein